MAAPGRQGVAGQPAQLGRQGHARPGCSRRGPTSEDRAIEPLTAAAAGATAARPDRASSPWPGSRPRCCSATPTRTCCDRLDLLERRPRQLPDRTSASRCAPASTTCGATPLTELRGRLRRDLRQPAPAQPVPHLLRARRHPQARDGAAAVQADLPAPSGFELDRRRAARPPVRRPRVRRHHRPRARPAAAPRPPRRARAAAALARRGRLAAGPAPSRRSPRPCRRCGATSGRRSAGSPPRDRPRRRSASRRTPPPVRPGPAAPDGPTLLPMPSFPAPSAEGPADGRPSSG